MGEAIQDNRLAGLTTPLGANKLLLRSASVSEQLGRPFRIELELLSDDGFISFDDIVGKNVTLRLDPPDGNPTRYFNGFVARFSLSGQAGENFTYHATVVPWLWFLTRSADCKVFTDAMTAVEIIQQIFAKYDFADFDLALQQNDYPVRDYCVQYRETDFNFVSRLMEAEGIYYYFEHKDGSHKLILCDDPNSHADYPDYGTLIYHPAHSGEAQGERVREWIVEQELQPGKYVLKDYDFKEPNKSFEVDDQIERAYDHSDLEMFDSPGEYAKPHKSTVDADGKHYAKIRLEELQAQYQIVHARADYFGVATGYTFTLDQFPRPDQNQPYLITSTNYHIQNDSYTGDETASASANNGVSCSFTAIPNAITYRPPRLTPKPIVQGPQTAIVVGAAGSEIFTDKYARVKVLFHWDRHSPANEKASCWVRVAQSWAGAKWGSIHIPRIGQEVIVEFIEGDPDRPLITGRLYNNNQMPPYTLPANKTQSGVKSRSSMSGGPDNFNEIRMEDSKGNEQLYVHAEKIMDVCVESNQHNRIFGNRHLIVGSTQDGNPTGSLYELVHKDHHVKIAGNNIEHIGGNMQLLVGKGDSGDGGNVDISIEKIKSELIGSDSNLHVKGAFNVKSDGDFSIDVANYQEKAATKHAVDAGQEIHLKAGMKVILEAGSQLTIKASGNFVDIGPSGVTISGKMVLINSGGSAGSGSGSSPTPPVDARLQPPPLPLPPGPAHKYLAALRIDVIR